MTDELQARADAIYAAQRDEDLENECPGHPAGPFDPMGETVYCDGSCVPVVRDPDAWAAVAKACK